MITLYSRKLKIHKSADVGDGGENDPMAPHIHTKHYGVSALCGHDSYAALYITFEDLTLDQWCPLK